MPVSIAFCSQGRCRIVSIIVTKFVDIVSKEKFIPKIKRNTNDKVTYLFLFVETVCESTSTVNIWKSFGANPESIVNLLLN